MELWEAAFHKSLGEDAGPAGGQDIRAACRFYRLKEECITPYTPEQNGLIELFLRSFKEECVWQHHFESFEEARSTIRRRFDWYN